MNDVSRRRFLAASGATAVAVGVVTVAGAATRSDASGLPVDHPEAFDETPVIVSLDDLRAGRFSVMHGEREFSVVDTDLAARIAGLAGLGA